jgi:hypothetical protein
MGSKQDEPIHPALIATVIAWGAKFSEHPLLVGDRQRNGGQSLLARTLIDRCREIAEATKVHRIPHKDHVVIALLIETLQCRECLHHCSLVTPHDPLFFGQKIRILKMVSNRFPFYVIRLTHFEFLGFHGFWLNSGIRNLLGLQVGFHTPLSTANSINHADQP